MPHLKSGISTSAAFLNFLLLVSAVGCNSTETVLESPRIMSRVFEAAALERLEQDGLVEVFRLESAVEELATEPPGTWAGPHQARKSAFRPSPDWVDRLQAVVGDPRSYEWQIQKDCWPEPGVLIRFHEGDNWTDLLLCFDCDMLAVGKSQYSESIFEAGTLRWANFDPVRAELLLLAQEAFPHDLAIQGLKPYHGNPPQEPSMDIDEWNDGPLIPVISLTSIPDARVKELGMEACLSMGLSKPRIKSTGNLDEDSHAHLFELLLLGNFERHESSLGINSKKSVTIDFPQTEDPQISAHQLHIFDDGHLYCIENLESRSPLRYWSAPQSIPYWRKFLSYDLELPHTEPAQGDMNPRHGIWLDRFEIDTDLIEENVVDQFGNDLVNDLTEARIVEVNSFVGTEADQPHRFYAPSFYYLQRTLLQGDSWRESLISTGPLTEESQLQAKFLTPMTEDPPVVLRVQGSQYSLGFEGNPVTWFKDKKVASTLSKLLQELR